MATVIELLPEGVHRVLDGKAGMTFVCDKMTDGINGIVVHVRDYRFKSEGRQYQIWSIPRYGYRFVQQDE